MSNTYKLQNEVDLDVTTSNAAVNKAPQMVRDEWTKAHFTECQKTKLVECVFAAVPSCVESLVGLCQHDKCWLLLCVGTSACS